jgi:hypothetical protein
MDLRRWCSRSNGWGNNAPETCANRISHQQVPGGQFLSFLCALCISAFKLFFSTFSEEGNRFMASTSDNAHRFLRHSVATVAYRGGKALRDAPNHFGTFHIGDKTRTPAQILAHMGDLFDWALSIAQGQPAWHDSTPLPWDAEIQRFFAAVKKFDDYLASGEPLQGSAEGLFQGPIADALNHVGQIAMLRRLAGSPILGENYFRADIAAGRVGLEQAAPRREFE